jgi:hypothetical protein
MIVRGGLAVLGVVWLVGLAGAGGLTAVAVRPDGKAVAVGGENRVVYLLDAGTLAVGKRFWVEARVTGLAYSADGARVLVEDETGLVRLLDAATGKEAARVAGVSRMAVSRRAGLVAVRAPDTADGAALRLLSLADLSDKGRVALPEGPSAYAFDAEGKRLVVLGKGVAGDEPRVPFADAPANLRGLARLAYQQRHDGYVAHLRTFDVASGKLLRQQKLWYTSDSPSTLLAPSGDGVRVCNLGNVCARVAADGTVTLFQTDVRINYALGASADGKHLLAGSVGEGTAGPPAGRRVRFELPALPGRSEVLNGFAVRPGGATWGVTSAFRVFQVGADGKLGKTAAVY